MVTGKMGAFIRALQSVLKEHDANIWATRDGHPVLQVGQNEDTADSLTLRYSYFLDADELEPYAEPKG